MVFLTDGDKTMAWLGQGLKSLQGQLKEFTEEVLTESTVEVDDPETELQVGQSCLSLTVFSD